MIIINKIKPNAVMVFGTGDICIATGHKEVNGKTIGFIAYSNQEPREIGTQNGDIKGGLHYDEEFPVIMEFTDVRSIDVLIESLNDAKSYMLGGSLE